MTHVTWDLISAAPWSAGDGFNQDKSSILAGGVQTSPSEITFAYQSRSGCATAGVGILTSSTAQGQVVQASDSQKALLSAVLNSWNQRRKLRKDRKSNSAGGWVSLETSSRASTQFPAVFVVQ